MKFIYSIVLFFLLIGCSELDENIAIHPNKSQSEFLTIDEANSLAILGIESFEPSSRGQATHTPHAHLYISSDSRGYTVNPSLYIVNFEEGGFAIISALKNVETPILAISGNGVFDITDNPNLQEYMDWAIEKNIQMATERVVLPRDSIKYKMDLDSTITCREKFLNVQWNQNSPYNKYFPLLPNSKSEHCPVGCVPLAIGQILAYHKSPNEIDGYVFDWEKMTSAKHIEDLTLTAQDDVAKLLYDLGLYIGVNCDDNGTGALSSVIPDVLAELGMKSSNLHSSLDSCISSFVRCGPSFMRGKRHNNPQKGHGWVTDAVKIINYYNLPEREPYKKAYYLNMIWGQGGKSDGYFLVENVDSSICNNYTSFEFVTHIRPK